MDREALGSLHTLNPTGRFSDRAGDYARFRPTYTGTAIDALLHGLGEPASLHAVDAGAGTGISARLLADRGVRVTALEPNPEMRAAAEPHPLVSFLDRRAESTGLAAGSADLLLAAQAFHWFEPRAALDEFARVLKAGGRLALMWNEGDFSDALTRAYYAAVHEASGAHPVHRPWAPAREFWEHPLLQGQRQERFRHEQRLSLEGLVGRAMSASYVPRSGPAHELMIRKLCEAHRAHADASGQVQLVYNTDVYLAERRKGAERP